MFSKNSDDFIRAQSLLEDIARSFLRGSVHGSREARNRLGDELVEVTKRLSREERARLARSTPTIVAGFPHEGRNQFDSFLDAALAAAGEARARDGDHAPDAPADPAPPASATQPRIRQPVAGQAAAGKRTRVWIFAAVAALVGLSVVAVQLLRDDQGSMTQADPAETAVAQRLPALLAGAETIAVSVDDGRGGYRRQYPQGLTYATVTGFTTFNEASGLDAWLRGGGESTRGSDEAIHTTIIPAAQEAAVRALGTARGAAVAIDPATGQILAMASAPGYDPNLLADPDTAPATLRSLRADATEPLSDRATAGILAAPGEVFEVVTAAAALSSGYTADTTLPGPAVLTIPQTTTQLANRDNQACAGTGVTSLADALRTSCTTAFAALGMKLGGRALREQAEAFGIGQQGHIPVPVQASVFPDAQSPHDAAWAAVGGSDVRITPLQLAMISSGIANRGQVAAPSLLDDHVGEAPTSPSTLTATTPEVAAVLAAMMRDAVASGSARDLTIPGLAVAGLICDSPTGTTGITWTTAFASTGGRSVAVAVALEQPDQRTLSTQAAAITRDVIRASLDVNT